MDCSALPTLHFITSLQHNDFYFNFLQEINESIQKEMGVGLDELLNPAKVSYFKVSLVRSIIHSIIYFLLMMNSYLTRIRNEIMIRRNLWDTTTTSDFLSIRLSGRQPRKGSLQSSHRACITNQRSNRLISSHRLPRL